MEKNFILNRRTVLGGAAALSAVGVLAACGSSKDSKATTQGATAGTDSKELYDLAETAVSELKDGGTLRLSVTSLGPDFNLLGTGVTAYTQAALSPVYYNGIWQADPMGKRTLSPEFAKSFDVSEENGVPVVSIELNPVAKFNDGTPIDYKALQATWNILKSTDGDYKIETSGIYSSVGSVERDGDDFKVKVTFAKPYYPVNILFGEILHPALLDKNVFNEGFVDNPHPEYAAGPFTIAEGGWNSSEKTLTLTRNEKWWGEKPILERIVFRQMDSAAERAAFKNDEIDAAPATAAASYKELKDVANTEMRRGVRLFSGGMIMNPARMQDVALRRAVMAGLKREAISKVRFQGLDYEEKQPGSMIHMPFSEYYRDVYPTPNNDAAAASKILEEAGYTKNGDYYEKGGKQATFKYSVFGDDPTSKAVAQTIVQQLKDAGINVELDARAASEFGKAMQAKDYDATASGYGLTDPDATQATQQFYLREKPEEAGTDEINKLIEKMKLIADDKERNLACDEIEKKHMAEVAVMVPLFNGPEYKFVKKGLRNYGVSLYQGNGIHWEKVGWAK
ncbi:MAG: ABC transporter family substrate-binding protein [Rothia mucilaginosa]|uniref:ABC transporter family substrate-binding protein n=1 Tax=Rothia mucilaginosa TaxID=43675 RepID=A0A930LP26_9MICC|nr:ABC transporter family substrate-binding protein [Rothia mucilaginosa]